MAKGLKRQFVDPINALPASLPTPPAIFRTNACASEYACGAHLWEIIRRELRWEKMASPDGYGSSLMVHSSPISASPGRVEG